MKAEEIQFLELLQDPIYRKDLLERLQALGLLDAFLQAEIETK